MKTVHKSAKLANVCYDIRGPIMDAARQMEEDGHKIIKLNIGNLAVFGFDAPEEIQQDMIRNLPNSAGYSDSKGIFAARKAVMHETQKQGIKGVTLDDIYLGNGARRRGRGLDHRLGGRPGRWLLGPGAALPEGAGHVDRQRRVASALPAPGRCGLA